MFRCFHELQVRTKISSLFPSWLNRYFLAFLFRMLTHTSMLGRMLTCKDSLSSRYCISELSICCAYALLSAQVVTWNFLRRINFCYQSFVETPNSQFKGRLFSDIMFLKFINKRCWDELIGLSKLRKAKDQLGNQAFHFQVQLTSVGDEFVHVKNCLSWALAQPNFL